MFQRLCKKCGKIFLPTSKTVHLCDDCWNKAMKVNKSKKKSAKKIGEGK
jgi:uncharacterized OB-fold protein